MNGFPSAKTIKLQYRMTVETPASIARNSDFPQRRKGAKKVARDKRDRVSFPCISCAVIFATLRLARASAQH